MAANRSEPAQTTEPAKNGPEAEAQNGDGKAGEKIKKPSGFLGWLPMIVSMAAMPLLAYATTSYLLLPKLQHELGAGAHAPSGEAPAKAATGAKEKEKEKEKEKNAAKNKTSVPLGRILVNVAGSVGTRYLSSSLTLVGSHKEFKEKIEHSRDQLLDVASSTLSSKSIADLEKPGARNLIRTELVTVFNNALGEGLVEEIYITEMAVQ